MWNLSAYDGSLVEMMKHDMLHIGDTMYSAYRVFQSEFAV